MNENHRAQSGRKGFQQGFSLVEVLVAILLLTVGLLALAKMQTQAVASNSFGNQLTQATFLAQDKHLPSPGQAGRTPAVERVFPGSVSQASDQLDN